MTIDNGLRAITDADLDMLLGWRNAPQVRRFMYSTHLIREDEHRRWYESIRDDDTRHPMIFVLDGKPAGFVNIGPEQPGGIADWGFYTAPDAVKGTGHQMGIEAISHAFNVLALHKICGEALAYNTASRNFHLRLGFQQEGALVDQYFDGHDYHHVIRFGMTVDVWRNLVNEAPNETNA